MSWPSRRSAWGRAGAAGGTEPTLYLQINDLLHFLRSHQTPSGIQRVQLGFITYGLSGQRAAGDPAFEFVFNQSDDGRLWKASRARLQRLVNYLAEANVDAIPLRRLVDDVLEDAVLVKPGKGDSFIILGAFWGMPGNTPLMASLREQGVSLGIYLYDLIPITYPEYCSHGLTVAFTRELCEALHFIDFALAISEYTAQEMRNFIRTNGYHDIPIEAVPLAHSLTGTQALVDADGAPDPEWTEAISELRGRDFVLCVCTIEPRKNHQYLYDAWKILKQDGVPVPDLVFVGRRGWHNDDFFTRLENSSYLNGSIRIVHDLSDTELATLYRACRFTVFPSIVEGWGLPVGESLSYGKLCVSSNVTSMPEVGGDLVEYIDPLNLRAGIETLRDLITNPAKVAQWEDCIRERFRPRSWNDVSRQFLAAVARLHAGTGHDSARKPLVAMLKSGALLRVGDLHRETNLRPVHHYADLQRLILAEGWYEPEHFGVWMKGSAGVLRFATDLPPGRQVIVYLKILGAPHTKGLKVLFPGMVAQPEELPISANQSETARLKTAVGADGRVTVELKVRGHYDAKAHLPRVFCIGLTLLAFVDAEDVAARAELLEQVMLDRS